MNKKDLPFPELMREDEGNNIVLSKGNITKTEIKRKAEDVIDAVNEGHISAIDVHLHIRETKEVCLAIEKGIKSSVADDVDRLHVGERERRGVKFELSKGSTKYDFSHDEVWGDLQDQLVEIRDKIKNREKLMIDALQYTEVADNEGIVVEPAKVVGGSAQVLKTIIPR